MGENGGDFFDVMCDEDQGGRVYARAEALKKLEEMFAAPPGRGRRKARPESAAAGGPSGRGQSTAAGVRPGTGKSKGGPPGRGIRSGARRAHAAPAVAGGHAGQN